LAGRWIRKGCLGAVVVLVLLVVGSLVLAYFQARRTPAGQPQYVALGSSFAAGAGLGKLQDNSPSLCARSVGGYPQRLARKLRVSSVDMSCGGASTKHLLHGGQFFQGPQVGVIARDTRLVTITVGGNDVGYIGDLSMLAARNTGSLFGWFVRRFWSGPKTHEERGFDRLRAELLQLIRDIRTRAPQARIVLATYPTILPQEGTCSRVGLNAEEAAAMRKVGDELAASTRTAAEHGGAILVDMNALGAAHNACSPEPWVNGWTNGGIAPFHPTAAGAEATSDAIASVLAAHQQL
jgi:lysophospholipase L1-like esterase